jgi:hypothetical protein
MTNDKLLPFRFPAVRAYLTVADRVSQRHPEEALATRFECDDLNRDSRRSSPLVIQGRICHGHCRGGASLFKLEAVPAMAFG